MKKKWRSSSSCSDDDVPLTVIKRNKHSNLHSSDSDQRSDDNIPLRIVKMNGHGKGYSSSDTFYGSSDDGPLATMKINGHTQDPNCYDSLCQLSIEACEFCDKISENRYSSLIHNMRHIIIPLINQEVHQCQICLHHFTSQEDLKAHKIKKHLNFNTIPQVQLVKNDRIEFFQMLTTMNSSVQIIGQRIPDLENITEEDVPRRYAIQFKDERTAPYKRKISLQYMKRQEVNVPQFTVPKQDFVEIIDLDEYEENKPSLKSRNFVNEPKTDSIKNRLIFEDDVVPNTERLLNDLTTDCKVNLEVFKPPWVDDEFAGKSVHFDELIKPGVYRCKKCGKGFPIRYDAIVHESSHITFKNSQITLCRMCNQYILGNTNMLRLHYLTKHKQKPIEDHRQLQGSKFKSDITITKEFDEEKNDEFDKKVLLTKTMKLCDMCFSFCKNKPPVTYMLVGSESEMGKRYRCDKCKSKFFNIKVVRREYRRKVYTFKKKKHMSNEDRLKMITHRFKMMKN